MVCTWKAAAPCRLVQPPGVLVQHCARIRASISKSCSREVQKAAPSPQAPPGRGPCRRCPADRTAAPPRAAVSAARARNIHQAGHVSFYHRWEVRSQPHATAMATAEEVSVCAIYNLVCTSAGRGPLNATCHTCGMQILVCRCARAASSSGSRSSADAAMAAARLFSPLPPPLLPFAPAWLAASDRATCIKHSRGPQAVH